MSSTIENASREQRAARVVARSVFTTTLFWFALALYLVAHVVLRLWETPNIGKNEVQEAVAAQVWAWGYHPRNPPLHTWLLMGSYSVFGAGLVAHLVLKYALLGLTYVFAFLCGRRLLSQNNLVIACAVAMSLLGAFAWTVHTALTHTLLLAVMNLATLWAALRLTEKRRLLDYAVFGVAIALGFLTKYSYALFLLPLLAAMLTQRELRSAILNWRFLVSLLIGVALFAPHGLWMLDARFDFVTFLRDKQGSAENNPYLVDLGAGLGQVTLQSLAFLFPLALIFPLCFRGAFRAKPTGPSSPWGRALSFILLFGLGLLVLDVVVLRATSFEVRYMTCALIAAPLAMFHWLDRRAPTENGLRWFGYSAAAVALVVFAGLAGKALLSQQSCRRCYEEMPITALEHGLRSAGFANGTIVAADYYLGGNMRLAFPRARVFATNYYVPQPAFAGEGRCVIVWNARNSGAEVPAVLQAYLVRQHIAPPASGVGYIEAPLRRSTRMDRFAYWIAPDADGACRPT